MRQPFDPLYSRRNLAEFGGKQGEYFVVFAVVRRPYHEGVDLDVIHFLPFAFELLIEHVVADRPRLFEHLPSKFGSVVIDFAHSSPP